MSVQIASADAVAAGREEMRITMAATALEDTAKDVKAIQQHVLAEIEKHQEEMAEAVRAAEGLAAENERVLKAEMEAQSRAAETAKNDAVQAMMNTASAERTALQAELDEVRAESVRLSEEIQRMKEEGVGGKGKAVDNTDAPDGRNPERSSAVGRPTDRRPWGVPLKPDNIVEWEDHTNIILMARIKPMPGMINQAPSTTTDGSETWGEISVRRNTKEQAVMTVLTPEKAIMSSEPRQQGKTFNFARVFGPECSNTRLFETLSPLLPAYTHGYQIVLVADGLSGAGKTHTLLKSEQHNSPLVPQTIAWIVERVINDPTFPLWVRITAVQYYQNKPSDLVAMWNDRISSKKAQGAISGPSQKALREKYEKIYQVPNATLEIDLDRPLQSATEACHNVNMMRQGRATSMNEASSRGHLVLTVRVEGREGSLVFIDLCGSEDPGTGDKETREEYRPINNDREAVKEVLLAVSSAEKRTFRKTPTALSKGLRQVLCANDGQPHSKLRLAIITHLIPGQPSLNLRLLNDVPRLEHAKLGGVSE